MRCSPTAYWSRSRWSLVLSRIPDTCWLIPPSPVFHRLAQDVRQVLLGDLLRRADEQALLLHRTFHQVVYVVLVVAELPDASRRADVLHELDDDPGERVLVRRLDPLAREQLGHLPV